MSVWSKIVPGLIGVALIGGCYEGAERDDLTQVRTVQTNATFFNGAFFNTPFFNGQYFNGRFFNGQFFNGQFFNSPFFNTPYFNTNVGNGPFFNGTRIDAITLDGAEVEDLELNGSMLEGVVEIDGKEVIREGDELVGMVISMTVDGVDDEDNEMTVPMAIRIDDAFMDPEAVTDDVMLYYVSMGIDGSDEWDDPCVDEEGNAQPVVFLRNYWDEESGDRIDDDEVLTMACTTGVLAHCAQWGYRPWADAEECNKKGKKCKSVEMSDYHQACTRMARADYCGNGESWTVPGTEIDVWDDLDPQINARAEDWDIEAEWRPDGAWCLNDIRQQGWKEEGLYPSCSKKQDKKWKRRASKCGKLKHKKSLIVSSFNDDV